MMLMRVFLFLLVFTPGLGQWSQWSPWSQCDPCPASSSGSSVSRLLSEETPKIKDQQRLRSKLCEGPEDCVDDGNTVRVGTEILKTLPCPPCPEQSEKSFGENSNLVPLSKQCHVEGSGEVICICPYGICKDDKEKINQCDGGKCDQLWPNTTITTELSPLEQCKRFPCFNGGECMEHSISRVCNCIPGYTGSDCEIEINECEPDPCYNGFCNDLINDYDCLCEKGWTGKNCDIDIDDCMDKPCQNGGYCNDLLNDYQCQCPPVYKGKNCEIDINECEANPCQNGGGCVNHVPGYFCICKDGFDGTHCETNIDDCRNF